MTEKLITDQVELPQFARPMAVQARLLALLEGLGIPHAPTWLSKPISEFEELGRAFFYKVKSMESKNGPEDEKAVGH